MIEAAARNKVASRSARRAAAPPTVPGRDGPGPRRRDRRRPRGQGLEQPARRRPRHVKPSDPPPDTRLRPLARPAPEVPFQANRSPASGAGGTTSAPATSATTASTTSTSACWGLGVDTQPNRVAALGGKYFFDDDQQFPDTQYVVFEYDAGNGGTTAAAAHLRAAHLVALRAGGLRERRRASTAPRACSSSATPSAGSSTASGTSRSEQMTGKVDLPAHHQNFLDAVPQGRQARGPGRGRPRLRRHLPPGEHQHAGCARRSSSTPRRRRSRTARTPTPCSAASTAPATGPCRRACDPGEPSGVSRRVISERQHPAARLALPLETHNGQEAHRRVHTDLRQAEGHPDAVCQEDEGRQG